MPLDLGTLWIVVGAVGFAVTCAFTALWRQARGVRGLGSVALAHGFLATSGGLIGGTGVFPPWLSFTASHALAVLGAALLLDGVRLLHGLPARRRLNVVLFAMVAVALFAAGDIGEGRASARLPIAIALPNVILGALMVDAGLTMVRRGRRPGEAFASGVVALCFGVVGAGRLAVAVVALGGGSALGFWIERGGRDPILAASLLASLMAGLGWTLGLFATVNRRFIALTARQAEYRATLGEIALTVMNRLELTPLLETVVSRGVALLKADIGFLYLETPDTKALRCRVWLGEQPVDELVAPNEGAVGRAWRSGEPVCIADYDAWPDRSPLVPPGMFGSMLAVPLRSAGKAIGSLGIARRRPGRRFGEEQAALLAGFGDLASIALDNARLFERERDARERSERLQAATQSLSSSLDATSVLDSILRELSKVLAADSVSILRLTGTQLEVLAARGVAAPFLGRTLDPDGGDGRRARVLEGRAPLILDDATPQPDAPWTATPSPHCWLGVPLLVGGQAIGLLALVNGELGSYTPEHARLATAFADQAAVALENARLYQDARREIEERKRAQAELERSEARHRDLFEQSLALICSHDLTGTLLSVNPAAAASLGGTPAALVGRNLGELIPEPHRAELAAYLEEIQRMGEAAGVMTIQAFSGRRRAWRYRNVLRRAHAEAPYVIGFAQDVTEEMLSQAALRDSEERFRQVAENLDAVLFVRQVQPPAILYMSPAYRTIFGRDPGELQPEADSLFADVWPEDRERVRAAFYADERNESTFDETYRVVRPDRAIRWVRTRTFPGHRNSAGKIERVVGISEDITPLKQAEAMRADLVRTLVHDLRTPLTSIVGCLEVLGARDSLKDGDLMLIAVRSTRKLQQMVDSLLDIDRLEQNELALQRDNVGLADLIEEALALVAGAAQLKSISLTQVAEASLPDAWADPDLILRVLTNLLGNSVKFTPDHGCVVVGAEMASEAMLRVRVRDSGLGIPSDLAPSLFQKFVTGRSKGAGTGLGLAFCRLVVEAHGGRIDIEESEPPGASVVFTLPVAKPN